MSSAQSDTSCRPDKFDGKMNFRRWKTQAEFWLITLGLQTALSPAPDSDSSEQGSDALRRLSISYDPTESPNKSFEEIDFHCRHRILSILSDRLYDKYFDYKSAKDIWTALEKEYGPDNATRISHLSIEFEDYKMMDGVSMGEQIHTFQDYLSAIEKCGTVYNESHAISILLKKLPPSWTNFANNLRHKIDNLNLMGVYNTIRIEEANRIFTNIAEPQKGKAYLTEHNDSPKSSKGSKSSHHFSPKGKSFKTKGKPPHNHPQKSQQPNSSSSSKSSGKNTKHCFVCGRTNHIARDCFFKKTGPPQKNSGPPKPQANVLEMGAPPSGTHFRSQVEEA